MRAKLSTTADATYSGFAPSAQTASDFFGQNAAVDEQAQAVLRRSANGLHRQGLQRADRSTQSAPIDLRGEGLLHDARNLVSAIGLYCDLLSMPGVLRPEHQQYPEELRLLGTRSRVLIEHLLRSLVSQNLSNQNLADQDQAFSLIQSGATQTNPADRRIYCDQPEPGPRARPASLRTIVERSSGLLSRVATGRPIELIYGPAADIPVWVSEEAIERILVNLVRNASQALDHQEPLASPAETEPHPLKPALRSINPSHRPHRRPGTSSLPGSRTAIRILVGPMLDRIGAARSWPFQHVRLVVEDSGCGMSSAQLHALLSGSAGASRGTHGIGFRVVRELVAASNGDLHVASTPGIGTRVQIEWPVAATPIDEKDRALMQSKRESGSTLKSPTIERTHRSIPAPSQPSAIAEGRQGAY